MRSARFLRRHLLDCNLNFAPIALIDSPRSCYAAIIGPEDSPYADGLYTLLFNFPESYPFVFPKITVITPIYHPNLNKKGEVSMNALALEWQPRIALMDVLLALQGLLSNPNFELPLMSEVAALYYEDPKEFARRAEATNRQYAM